MARRRPRGLKSGCVVVDTNVVAYQLLGTPQFVKATQAFWAGLRCEPVAPALWEAEIANVLWMARRASVLTEGQALAALDFAGALGVRSIDMRGLWRGALARSLIAGVATYDTLFVELAVREDTRVVTWDRQLLKAFPDRACRPPDWPS